ncbi:MAG: hypothetical protein HYU77_02780 [Betaproteobacteria bacterium]|nr:hypothetical protein [Betaproteobacteria bacterium]
MLSKLRHQYANLLTSGAQLMLVFVGFQFDSREGWIGVLATMCVISFFAWIATYRRYRAIGDTPTSRVASAAQGYVEFVGKAVQHAGRTFVSKLTVLPCLWYRYSISRKTGDNKWEHVESGVSSDTFLLQDATGACVIDPDEAEIITSHKQTWHQGDYRYTEWLLLPNDHLYALGEFATLGGAGEPLDPNSDIAALLAEWKKDQPALKKRFDLNQDGEIDLKEWGLARRQARRDVEKRHAEAQAKDTTVHVMRAPKDGRMYLLSNLEPEKLGRRYALWGWFHLVVFFGAGAGAFMVPALY